MIYKDTPEQKISFISEKEMKHCDSTRTAWTAVFVGMSTLAIIMACVLSVHLYVVYPLTIPFLFCAWLAIFSFRRRQFYSTKVDAFYAQPALTCCNCGHSVLHTSKK